MVFLNDGLVGTVSQLMSGSQDSNGKTLNFKLNDKTGSYEAEGTDNKIYAIDPMIATAKVSVREKPSEEEEKAKAAAAAKPTTSTTTTSSTKKY